MSTAPNRRFPARMSALPGVLAYARSALAGTPFEPHGANRVELVLEELFTNTVMHGYGGDSDRSVWLRFDCEPTALAIEYIDEAPPYDPLQHRADLEFEREARPAGGLGILLARRLADRVDYRYADGRNVLTLRFDAPVREDAPPDGRGQ